MPQLVVEMTGDEAKLWKSLDRIVKKNKQMEGSFKKVGDQSRRSGNKARASWGAKQIGELKGYAAGLIGVGVAAKTIGDAMRFAHQETDKAIMSVQKLTQTRARLSQVATSSTDLKQMEIRADAAAGRFGVERDVARRVLFSARSEGFDQGSTFEQLMRAAPVVDDVEAAASVAGQIPALFEGSGLTPMQALNAVLSGATESRLDFQSLGRALPQAAEGGALAGASPEETIAALSVLSSKFKSGETAADRIKAFATKAGLDDRLKGKGLVDSVKTVQHMSKSDRDNFLGESQEVNVAFEYLTQQMAEIERIRDVVKGDITRTSTNQSLLNRKLRTAREVQAPAFEMNRARIQREIANEQQLADEGVSRRAGFDRGMAAQKRAGKSGFEQYVASSIGSLAEFAGMDGAIVEAATRVNYVDIARGNYGLSPVTNISAEDVQLGTSSSETMSEMRDAMKETAENTRLSTRVPGFGKHVTRAPQPPIKAMVMADSDK